MKYLFWAAFILLLDVSISQDVDIPCKNTADCLQFRNSTSQEPVCLDGICKCMDERNVPRNCVFLNGTKLMEEQLSVGGLIGRVCSLEKDCTAVDVNANCNTTRKQCACNANFVPSADNQRCLPAMKYNQSGCEIAKQCLYSVGNSTCKEGVCICEENYHYASGSCWATKEFGASCSVTAECSHVDEAVCDNQFRCSCPNNRVAVNVGGDAINAVTTTSCFLKAAKIDDDCVESIQCGDLLGTHSVCVDHRCKCHENYHHSTNVSKCIPNLELGAECQGDEECSHGEDMGVHGPTRCLANKCECAEDFENVGGKCEPVNRGSGNSASRRFGDVSIFAVALAYFGIVSLVL